MQQFWVISSDGTSDQWQVLLVLFAGLADGCSNPSSLFVLYSYLCKPFFRVSIFLLFLLSLSAWSFSSQDSSLGSSWSVVFLVQCPLLLFLFLCCPLVSPPYFYPGPQSMRHSFSRSRHTPAVGHAPQSPGIVGSQICLKHLETLKFICYGRDVEKHCYSKDVEFLVTRGSGFLQNHRQMNNF